MNVTVLGASGMLGSMVVDVLAREPGLAVTATVRDERLIPGVRKGAGPVAWKRLDAESGTVDDLRALLGGADWVVNAIGVIKPLIHDDRAGEVERAIRVNALFPHLLAQAIASTSCRVLQIATDCVYSGQLKAVFLSRLSMKKNLDYALTILKSVRARVSFTIYGVLEDPEYWHHCQAIIAALPPNITVDYKGPLPHEKVVESLQAHEVFLFPTRGENFGHVILEALSAGLPVLISDQTPWRGLTDKGIGWDLPLDEPAGFSRRIEELAAVDQDAYQPLRQRAWQYAQGIQRDDKTVQANRSLFQKALIGCC